MIGIPLAARWAASNPFGRSGTAITAEEFRFYLRTHLIISILLLVANKKRENQITKD